MSQMNLASQLQPPTPTLLDHLLTPVRNWLDSIEITDRKTAHRICKLIPAQCPFERDVMLFGRKVAHIPPMCKLNPLYDQFVGLRFRSLCYLVDVCGETISF
ncbi:Mo-dependent nitrogenase C-terminal domain-containing protein [Alkalinema pantanalense CENA528]|uniref:Mo-dependent nitrogenase C-terminal domain-containing protein n=1 Tax=Alkalinema pantanalense TaxID=1620705 RepID=UPI003D6E4D11